MYWRKKHIKFLRFWVLLEPFQIVHESREKNEQKEPQNLDPIYTDDCMDSGSQDSWAYHNPNDYDDDEDDDDEDEQYDNEVNAGADEENNDDPTNDVTQERE